MMKYVYVHGRCAIRINRRCHEKVVKTLRPPCCGRWHKQFQSESKTTIRFPQRMQMKLEPIKFVQLQLVLIFYNLEIFLVFQRIQVQLSSIHLQSNQRKSLRLMHCNQSFLRDILILKVYWYFIEGKSY